MGNGVGIVKDARGITAVIIHIVLGCLSAFFLIPLLLVASISLTQQQWVNAHGFSLWPHVFSLEAYQYILQAPSILLHAYGVTIFITVVGTTASLLMVTLIGYVISRPDYAYRGVTTLYIYFTMLFSGGLVPFYFLMTKYLHLGNTVWAMIVPGLVSPFYVLVMKGFLAKIPMEIIEAAKIDGAGEWRIFFRIVLPMATPALATVGVFTSFAYWTEWFNALLFTTTQSLTPIQLLLYRIFDDISLITSNPQAAAALHLSFEKIPTTALEMAMVMFVAVPILAVFPLLRRYYVQGLTVGSLKG